MTLDEAIIRYTNNAEYERTHGNLQGCLEFKQFVEWLFELKDLREQKDIMQKIISNDEQIIEGDNQIIELLEAKIHLLTQRLDNKI